ncbi:glutathione S-transferase [Gammaproteobacteria bacterium 42_54_T18]|nr:glutathione S-transferase [Gammaproteobacteria bacterium 42_54_T18]
MSSITLHRHALSGHSHRVEVFLSILGLEANIVDVDLANGAHKEATFLSKNSFGQVPVLDDGDVTLSDSNAILVYLASKYDNNNTWLPSDIVDASNVQRFLSVAAGKVAYGPALARLVNVFGANLDKTTAIATAHGIIFELNGHLEGRDWLVTAKPTIADVANYAYIAHAPEGDISLEAYPNIRAWISRFESLTGFVPMQSSAAGLNA